VLEIKTYKFWFPLRKPKNLMVGEAQKVKENLMVGKHTKVQTNLMVGEAQKSESKSHGGGSTKK
jgi:hypothetical protein